MDAPASDTQLPIRAATLSGLPARAMVALAARAALRAMPALPDLSPEPLREAAIAWAVTALQSLGRLGEPLRAAADASLRFQDAPVVGSARAAAAAMADPLQAAVEVSRALRDADDLLQGEPAEAARAANWADLEWLREWSRGKRAADGIVAPDFYARPLWHRPDDDGPPELLTRQILEVWHPALIDAGLSWLMAQHENQVKGGGLDVAQLASALSSWHDGRQAGVETGNGIEPDAPASDADSAVPRGGDPDDAEDAEDAEDSVLPGGIAVTAADTPAITDHLGRRPLVHTLADMLAAPEQALPMTIALLGDWGAGKTSVIEQLKRRLDELARDDRVRTDGQPRLCRYLFATFNAWEYEQTDNLRAGLAQEVVNGLTADLGHWDKLVLAVTKAAKGNVWEFWSTLAGLALAITGIILGYQLATPDQVDERLRTAELLGGGGLAAFGAYLLVNAWRTGRRLLEHPLATQMATYLKLPSYGKHLGEVPVIKKEIGELCAQRLDAIPNGRLLVVVDDLDRCHPAAVTQTLDAIRLVMNLPRVAVILAVDDRIAFRAVADHYKGLEEAGKRSRWEIARDYLGKIIQLPVNLYDPWPSEVAGFVREHLFQVSEAAEAEGQRRAEHAAQVVAPAGPVTPPSLTAAAQREVGAQGLDPASIPASGKDGRITLADVQRYLRAQRRDGQAVAPSGAVDDPVLMESQAQADQEPLSPPRSVTARAEEREALMEDTVAERELFAELTRDLAFNNPRQLIRLRNSYRLLKGYRHSRGTLMTWPVLAGLMHGLFWYEYLYQLRLEQREHAELVLWLWAEHSEWQAQADRRGRNPPVVAMARRLHRLLPADQWGAEYGRLMRTVDLVVLPNAQVGLVLDRPRADAVWTARTDGKQLLPDPWGSGYSTG